MAFFVWDSQTQRYFNYLILSASALYLIYRIFKRKQRTFELVGNVESLYSFPVKSCGGVKLEFAECTKLGLKYKDVTDRQWLIVDSNNKMIDLKSKPRLWLVKPRITDEHLILTAPDMIPLKLPKIIHSSADNTTNTLFYRLYGDDIVEAVDCGLEASQWISDYLILPGTRIVFSAPDLPKRDITSIPRPWKNNAKKGDMSVFSYMTPYMLESASSLDEVNQGLENPAEMLRFRPGIVITGSKPFDEDTWEYIQIGDDNLFRIVEPCRRCIITTINPNTGIKDKQVQPLKHLRSIRCRKPYGQSPCFGIYITLDSTGGDCMIRVGQPIRILRR
ncbi:hypothetical protein LOTGIDRAFT_106029 [Lottia gigantea]|uniref:MOSC domain-containing protein n=1 Tax=Lottia gigantea TaxID=225164 RepID=V3ZXU7_LOTGI|nr:hypothetical protein LOTGIDRAFT_106029 [Lottia gigantea]ESO89237.1 hypothetical protein LOTGIDRAFT_106029 [Lottia gigantea]